MAYFLKKAKLKGRTYLSIVESYYSRDFDSCRASDFKKR